MTRLEWLLCNSCGAPLQVPSRTNYVKCNHCNTQLAVHRDAGVTFTESIKELNETTLGLRDQVAQLTHQQRLADLDRQWDQQRESFMITNNHGRKHLPNSAASTIGGIVAIGFGIVWMILTMSITANGPAGFPQIFPFFGIFIIGMGIFGMIQNHSQATKYQEALARYQAERKKISDHLSRDE